MALERTIEQGCLMRVAIVGAGAIGSYLADRIVAGAAGDVQLVAIADLPERRDFLTDRATRLGCRWFDDPTAVLDARPEVVIEAVSPAIVRANALAWLEGGAGRS
jgi:predicted dinucleotide-utilizing enzyme